MKSSGFILYFALVVALTLFACMQPPPSGAGKATAVCDSNAIAAKVVDLNPPFDAEAFGDAMRKDPAATCRRREAPRLRLQQK